MRSKLTTKRLVACATVLCAMSTIYADDQRTPRFRSDDPLWIDDDRSLNAGAATRDRLSGYADFVLNTFTTTGDARSIPAVNVNSLGEVPDSSWFTNRIGMGAMSVDDIARGPDRVASLGVKRWTIVAGKSSGRQAGFRAVDADSPGGPMYQIEFDSARNPEMATGAEVIGSAIYHALGYHVVDVYLIDLDPDAISIAPTATIDVAGRTRPFTRRDLERVLRGAARKPNGHYRASASRFAEGKNLGPFRYYGTRPDDPNDIYPHEHRRELRGNRVFTAWLNHDDSRAINTLDMLVGAPGHQHVKHYMFDFGSMLGSGTNEEDHPWVGHEYVVQGRPALLTLASMGLWRRPFIRVDAPSDLPAAGNFTADGFTPSKWRPHYPNPAFRNMQPEDAFWAARLVSAFSADAIARIVEKAQFSDPKVADHVIGTLLRRRERALRAWLTSVNPIVDARIENGNTLRFRNAAVEAGIATPPDGYQLSWFRFDNTTGLHSYVASTQTVVMPSAALPLDQLNNAEYVGAEIATFHPQHAVWRESVRFYFRSSGMGWSLTGVDRSTERATGLRAAR